METKKKAKVDGKKQVELKENELRKKNLKIIHLLRRRVGVGDSIRVGLISIDFKKLLHKKERQTQSRRRMPPGFGSNFQAGLEVCLGA